MRTIKELLQIMLDNQERFEFGLCFWGSNLYYAGLISFDENMLLDWYIKNNKPSIFSSSDAFIQRISLEAYYWKVGVITLRIKWLKEHINKL